MAKTSLLQNAKAALRDRAATLDDAELKATSESRQKVKPTSKPKPKLDTLHPKAKHVSARQAEIEKARNKDKRDLAVMRAKQEQDRIMDEGMKAGAAKPKKYAKGGKVRGCGIAKRGLGKGARGR